nr:unnamed protein product [Callosobruchus analis]
MGADPCLCPNSAVKTRTDTPPTPPSVAWHSERLAFRNAAAHSEPVPEHFAGRPEPPDPVLRPSTQRVLLRQEPALLRRHPLLLPERRSLEEARKRAVGRLLGGDQVLRVGELAVNKFRTRAS